MGSGLTTLVLGWLGWEVLTNPDMTFWVNQFTPGQINRGIPAQDQPKKLEEILQSLEQGSQKPGDLIQLNTTWESSPTPYEVDQVAIPILRIESGDACAQSCRTIQEIQVYRSLQLPRVISWLQLNKRYRLVDRMGIAGPSEKNLKRLISTVTRTSLTGGANRPLPLPTIERLRLSSDAVESLVSPSMEYSERYAIAPHQKVWLMLSGFTPQGNATAAYGQLIYFDPRTSRLSLMMDWLSPSGSFPTWQNLTGDSIPEIVIDQSVGLEPAFSVYQLKQAPRGGALARPIQLTPPAINHDHYRKGLKLAQNGLWGSAYTRLSQLKAKPNISWNPKAQAQLDFIQLHADLAKTQTQQSSVNVVEQLYLLLLRGSWTEAQAVLQKNPELLPEFKVLIENEGGTIRDRLQTTLEIDGKQSPAADWQVILRYFETNSTDAKAWLKTQSFSSTRQQRLVKLIDSLDKSKQTQSTNTQLKTDQPKTGVIARQRDR